MKNFFKTRFVSIFGIIAMVAVIGFGVVACDDGNGGGGGPGMSLYFVYGGTAYVRVEGVNDSDMNNWTVSVDSVVAPCTFKAISNRAGEEWTELYIGGRTFIQGESYDIMVSYSIAGTNQFRREATLVAQ